MLCLSKGSGIPFKNPRAPTYLNGRSLGCVTIRYLEPSSHYLGNWSLRDVHHIFEVCALLQAVLCLCSAGLKLLTSPPWVFC